MPRPLTPVQLLFLLRLHMLGCSCVLGLHKPTLPLRSFQRNGRKQNNTSYLPPLNGGVQTCILRQHPGWSRVIESLFPETCPHSPSPENLWASPGQDPMSPPPHLPRRLPRSQLFLLPAPSSWTCLTVRTLESGTSSRPSCIASTASFWVSGLISVGRSTTSSTGGGR